MIKFLMKLPGWLLILLSRKKQIQMGKRILHAPFQFLLKLSENMITDWETITPDQFRAGYLEQSRISSGFPSAVKWKDHEVEVKDSTITVREYYSDSTNNHSAALVYFHGGGWVIGDIETHHELTGLLCSKLEAKVFSVDYRLSPESKFPAPLEDCEKAFEWVINNSEDLGVDKDRIAAGGDSAGGNLTASLCLKRRNEEKSLPKAQLLFYPVTDLQLNKESMDQCADGFFLTKDAMFWFRKHYLNAVEEMHDPLVSPLLASDLSNLPPAIVSTAGFDPLRDEGDEYANKLISSGVKVFHQENDGFIHGFANMGYIPKVPEALDEICTNLKEMMK